MDSIKAVLGSKILPFSWVFLLLFWTVRNVYVWGTLALSCPEGFWPVFRFGLIAVLVLFGPGLFFNRALRVRCESLSIRLLLILVMSLSASALLAWQLYLFGAYSRGALLAGLVVWAAGGIYGFRGTEVRRLARDMHVRWNALSVSERIGIAVGLVFLQGIFESGVGMPFVHWDALVSWDKWAVDMAARHGLGQYVMGGYPQFLPAVHSIFYKIAGTGAEVFPAEHLLLHGLVAIYVAILMLSIWCLGRRLRVPGLLAFAAFVWNRDVFDYLVGGYVDVPLVAMVFAAFALVLTLCRGAWSAAGWLAEGWILALSLFSVVFMKGNGLVWTFWIVLYMATLSWRRAMIPAVAWTALFTAPFFGHQLWYTRHFDLAERSPFLHAFRLVPAHTSLFNPNGAHARMWLERLQEFHQVPDAALPCVLVAVVGLGLWALSQRRLVFFALAGILMLALWFHTGSYDLRNAYVPLGLLCFALVGAPFDARLGKRGKWVRLALALGAVGVALAGGGGDLFAQVFGRPFRSFAPPRAFTLPVGSRHRALRPISDVRKLLFDTPFGQRAAHLNSGFWGLYRILAPRGTYALNANSYQDARRFDVLIRDEAFMELPPDFVPVAVLRRMGATRSLCLFKPEFQPLAVDIRPAESPAGTPPLVDARLPAGQTCVLTVAGAAAASSEGAAPRDGVLSVRISPAEAEVTVRLHPDDARRDPYAAYFSPIRDGDRIRLLYWMRDEGPAFPRLVATAGGQDVRLTAVEWGQ